MVTEAQRNCRRRFESKHREYFREKSQKLRLSKKIKVLRHYSINNKISCVCCGVDNIIMLTIDHIKEDGNKHRCEIKRTSIYTWLINHDYPEGFQTLCWNCNYAKHRCGGICPHKFTKSKIEVIQTW